MLRKGAPIKPRWHTARQWNFPKKLKEQPGAGVARNAAVETRAAGAELAPGVQPGLPQMVMMHARNYPTAHERGSGNSAKKGG